MRDVLCEDMWTCVDIGMNAVSISPLACVGGARGYSSLSVCLSVCKSLHFPLFQHT